jgi:hypothetical protein
MKWQTVGIIVGMRGDMFSEFSDFRRPVLSFASSVLRRDCVRAQKTAKAALIFNLNTWK